MNPSSKYYNEFYSEVAKIDALHNNFKKIEDFLPQLKQDSRILDVGCGYGSVSSELVKRGYDVYGMEINADALQSLRKKGFQVIETDINRSFGVPDDFKFDLILILDVLEHVFDPLFILEESQKRLSENGTIIISVPLYFDLFDRIRVLFTGSIISYDNLCYGKEIYRRFRSYNYDHIRFFSPRDMPEMLSAASLKAEAVKYNSLLGYGFFTRAISRVLARAFLIRKFPGLLAHSMLIRAEKS